MNNDVQVLLSQLTGALDIPDRSVHHQPSSSTALHLDLNECDPLVCLANRIRVEDTIDLGHFAFTTNNFEIQEPENYEKVMASEQCKKREMQSLIDHQTWDLIPKQDVTPGHSPLKGKRVYKIKRGVDNQITRFKARWVVKDYLQLAGVDIDQTFAAIVNLMAFRALFAIAAFYNLDIEQMGVTPAFPSRYSNQHTSSLFSAMILDFW